MRYIGVRIWVLGAVFAVFGASVGHGQTPSDEPRLSNRALQLLDDLEQGRPPVAFAPQAKAVQGDRVILILEPRAGTAASIDRNRLRVLGARVEAESRSYLRVSIPFRQARRLVEHSGIAVIRTATPAYEVGFGSIVSESAALTGAAVANGSGYTGAGIKVAVVDLGFIGLNSAIASGELPSTTTAVDFTGTGIEADTEHGVGVSEHVMDMAPGAELYCIKVSDEVDLQNAADYCAANGIRVANHSVGWVIASYYDGTGPINAVINESRSVDGVFWAVSAGNDAQRHWRGGWSDADNDTYLEFSGADESMGLTSGSSIGVVFLNWNQYGNSLTNLDVYVLNKSGVAIAGGLGPQNGPQDPSEAVAFTYRAGQAPYTVLVKWVSGPTAGLDMTLFSFYNTFEHAIAANSMSDPANAPGAFSVSAIDQSDWLVSNPPPEYFSSQGPTNDGRQKPEIAAPDGTSSLTYGFQASFGTSFSSPTVAGAAAVLFSEDPSRTADNVETLLRATAIDVGAPGWDPVYGHGLLNVQSTPAVEPPPLALEPIATGLAQPTFVTAPEGDTERLYVLQLNGTVRVIENGVLLDDIFLDIQDRAPAGGYIGLLGMAFHPAYPVNDSIYVLYSTFTDPLRTTQVSRFTTSDSGPNGMRVADASSEEILFVHDANIGSHNGGTLCFGPNDGYLYFGTGDGGGGCCYDPLLSGQDLTSIRGKILRIDVDNADPGLNYAIPPTNPFVADANIPDEIWAYGVRNPFRIGFDRDNGDFYIGDVGQDEREEINFQPATSAGGENYGWSVFEGTLCGATQGECDALEPFVTFPIVEIAQPDAQSITGGYVYRGSEIPGLQGTYFFGDYVTQRIWSFRNVNGAAVQFQEQTSDLDPQGTLIESVVAIGEDGVGELYVVNYEGSIYKIVVQPPNLLPTASFTHEAIDLDVQFTDTSTDPDGTVDSWLWDFGDGASSIEQHPLHTYGDTGVYDVTLTVTDNNGESDTTAIVMVSVTAPPTNEAPTVEAGPDDTILITEAVSLNGVVDDDGGVENLSLTWSKIAGPGTVSFDDATSAQTTATFDAMGVYELQLSAFDGELATEDNVFVTVNPVPLPAHQFLGGVVSGVTNTAWTTVQLPYTYASMVVVCAPVNTAAGPARHVRVRNATGASFDVRADRADGSAAVASNIDIHYFVVEEGVYTLAADGITMEAASFTSTTTDATNAWNGQARTYQNAYTAPVVLGQVMTYNDPRFSVFWSRGATQFEPPSPTDLRVGKHAGGDSITTRANERIGYVVIETGSGTIAGRAYECVLGPDIVAGVENAPPYFYTLSGAVPNPVAAVVTQSAMDGNDGGWAILHGAGALTPGTVALAVEEDQLGDAERTHTHEQFAYMVFGPTVGPPPNQPPTASFTVGASGLDATFTDTSLDFDGAIVQWLWDFGDGDTATVQHPSHTFASPGIYDVTLTVTDDGGASDVSDSVAVQVQAQAGGGPKLTGGMVSAASNGAWTTVTLPYTYDSMVVVCTPMYTNAITPRVVRVRNASGNSFDVRADRADNLVATAPDIPVQYFVVEEGVYNIANDGIKLEAAKFSTTLTDGVNNWVGVARSYTNAYTAPVVLGQVMTYNDPDYSIFWSRGAVVSDPPSSSTLFVGKHVGEDPDTTRAAETIGYVVIEAGSGVVNDRQYECGLGADSVAGFDSGPPFVYPLSGTVTNVASAVVTQSAMDGNHGSWAALYGVGAIHPASLDLGVDEDQANDAERGHVDEQVAYLVISNPAGSGENLSPTAGFSFVRDGLSIHYTDTSADVDGTVVEWAWDFGDGDTSTEQHPVHAYAAPGQYTVVLSITDDGGAMGESTPQLVEVISATGPRLNAGIVANVTNTGWTTVTLPDIYTSMVVVGTPMYTNTDVPRVVRIRNASGTSFDVRADRADGVTSAAPPIAVYYMVVEEGVYTQAVDGVTMEAVTYLSTLTDTKSSWVGQQQVYANAYTDPVVLGQVLTYNDARFSVFWCHDGVRSAPPSNSALWTGKHVGEDPNTVRADETIGYIVIESGAGTMTGRGYVAATGTDTIQAMGDAPPYLYGLSGFPASAVVATQAAMDGIDGTWAALYGPNPLQGGNLSIACDEDQLFDAERKHTNEQVAYILFD